MIEFLIQHPLLLIVLILCIVLAWANRHPL